MNEYPREQFLKTAQDELTLKPFSFYRHHKPSWKVVFKGLDFFFVRADDQKEAEEKAKKIVKRLYIGDYEFMFSSFEGPAYRTLIECKEIRVHIKSEDGKEYAGNYYNDLDSARRALAKLHKESQMHLGIYVVFTETEHQLLDERVSLYAAAGRL